MWKKELTYKVIHGLIVAVAISLWILAFMSINNNKLFNMYLITVILFLVMAPFLSFVTLMIKEANIANYEIPKRYLYSCLGMIIASVFVNLFLNQIVGYSSEEEFLTIIEYKDFYTVLPIFVVLLISSNITAFIFAKRAAVKQEEKEKNVEQKFTKNHNKKM